MFYLHYLLSELRRRPGRTALTALGLGVGIGLVVIVGALTAGLDDAQDEVLEPLRGVGTDLSLTRPISVPADTDSGVPSGDPFGQLSPREQRQLERENEGHDAAFNYSELGQPGDRFSEETLLTTNLSVPDAEVAQIRDLGGASDAAGSLTLRALLVEGEVPAGEVVDPHGPGAGIEFSDRTVSGVDVRKPDLAPVTRAQVTEGRYFADGPKQARGEALVDLAFARQDGIDVGDEVSVTGSDFEVVGLTAAPLADAEDLSSKLGTALAVVALLAAFLIATLLTLSSVQERTRELGTLKALGWRQRLVIRQVTGESLVQGALGGLLGAAIGIAGAAVIDAIGPTLEASVEQTPGAAFSPFGQGDITAGSTDVVLGAPVDAGLLLLAIGLAIVGGLAAGAARGLRAARLRPAEALRSAE